MARIQSEQRSVVSFTKRLRSDTPQSVKGSVMPSMISFWISFVSLRLRPEPPPDPPRSDQPEHVGEGEGTDQDGAGIAEFLPVSLGQPGRRHVSGRHAALALTLADLFVAA